MSNWRTNEELQGDALRRAFRVPEEDNDRLSQILRRISESDRCNAEPRARGDRHAD